MIDYLIELIFKDIPHSIIGSLINELSGKGEKIVGYTLTCDSCEIDWGNEKTIENIFLNNCFFGLFITVSELLASNICLPNCGICSYKFEKKIDLEINFQLLDLKNAHANDLTENLMNFAKSLSNRYQLENYICGIEPAADWNTQLFTNRQLGPLSKIFSNQRLYESNTLSIHS